MAKTDPGKKMNKIMNSPEKKLDDDVYAGIPKKSAPSKTAPTKAIDATEATERVKTPLPQPAPQEPVEQEQSERQGEGKLPWQERGFRALWTVASLLSMLINIIVIAVLIALYQNYTVLEIPEGLDEDTPRNLLKGLYDNFERMEHASIETEIKVNGSIPVEFPLTINQETTVVLNEAVTIDGARVALTTGGLNIINAPATVTLPEGTNLPIILDMEVQVDQQVPIQDLPVPVNIPLKETALNEPFTGLQDVIRPLYCLVDKDAKSIIDESAICQ